MKFCEAFDATIKEFRLSAKEISVSSGVREASISEFRRGLKEIQTDNLERLIAVLPPEAKQFLFLRMLVGEMDTHGMATLLSAIAYQLRSTNTETPHTAEVNAALSLRCG